MWRELLTAASLVLVIEGILPFLSPNRWRRLAVSIANVDDTTVRFVGLASMVLGVVILYVVR